MADRNRCDRALGAGRIPAEASQQEVSSLRALVIYLSLTGTTRRVGERIAKDSNLAKEVRGRGLMIGVEFYQPQVGKKLSEEYLVASFAAPLLHDHRIITAYTPDNPKVIRFEPPLVVTDEQVDHVL